MAVLDHLWGNKNFQSLFERLYSISLKGMNYGRASDYLHNGEVQVLEQISSMVNSASTVIFDVGANQGEFTKHILEIWGGMSYQVYAFEPSRKTFEILRNALVESPFIHLYNFGFGDSQGPMELYYDKEGSGLASVYKRDLTHYNIEFKEHETIDLTTLDIFCKQNHIDNIDFLKIDVEGYEMAVFKGAKQMLSERKIRIIQFEFGGCNLDSHTYFRDFYNFFKDEFVLYRILSNGLKKIKEYSEKLEVFQSANYLAVRKDLVTSP